MYVGPLSSDDVYEAEDAWLEAIREYGEDSDEARRARENYDAVRDAYDREREEEDRLLEEDGDDY
jgi:hypothetical protein